MFDRLINLLKAISVAFLGRVQHPEIMIEREYRTLQSQLIAVRLELAKAKSRAKASTSEAGWFLS